MNEKTGYINKMGLVSPPYRVGKYVSQEHLAYRIWYNYELLAECKTFEDCVKVAEKHLTEHKKDSIIKP